MSLQNDILNTIEVEANACAANKPFFMSYRTAKAQCYNRAYQKYRAELEAEQYQNATLEDQINQSLAAELTAQNPYTIPAIIIVALLIIYYLYK
jgi:hypothetical protein